MRIGYEIVVFIENYQIPTKITRAGRCVFTVQIEDGTKLFSVIS
jgi:hypothetical protein